MMRAVHMGFFSTVVTLLAGISAAEQVAIDPQTGFFVTPDGRALTLHGVNVVRKKFPWHPSRDSFDSNNSLVAEDMANLKKWGINFVRLGMMWPGVEPSPGEYNQTYLRVMREIVDDLYAQGIYTSITFHQDVLARKFCGEGVPDWMTPMFDPLHTSCSNSITGDVATWIGQCHSFSSYNFSLNRDGFPSIKDCTKVTFDQYFRTPDVTSMWQKFLAQEDIQDKFKAYWRTVARNFAGAPGVIGYDLINEPQPGDYYQDVRRILPGFSAEHLLQPLYQSVTEVIQAEDPKAVIMYEPPPVPATFPDNIPVLGGVHSSGFTQGPADAAHQVLSYHIYSCAFAVEDCSRTNDPPSVDCDICDKFAQDAVTKRNSEARSLGGAALVTEFGAVSESAEGLAEIDRVASRAEAKLHGYAYWQFKYFDDITTMSGPIEAWYYEDGRLQTEKVKALSRTYAPQVAGVPKETRYDATTGSFRLRYESGTGDLQGLPTEIYLNEAGNYPGGYATDVLNGAVSSGASAAGRLLVQAAGPGLSVSVAVVRPPSGAPNGTINLKDHSVVTWQVEDAAPGFELELVGPTRNDDNRRAIKVYDDLGNKVSEMSPQGDLSYDLPTELLHNFLFDYRIEVYVPGLWITQSEDLAATIRSSSYGPLIKKRVKIFWDRSRAVQEITEAEGAAAADAVQALAAPLGAVVV